MSPEPIESRQPDPALKRLLDNPWILLVLGLLIPFISYTAWGWFELLTIEAAKLP